MIYFFGIFSLQYSLGDDGRNCAAEQELKYFIHDDTFSAFEFPSALVAAELDAHFAVDVFAEGAAGGGAG